MSNVSNRHNVVEFKSGKSVPLTGQRLVRVMYKPDRKTKIQKYQSVCVSVPQITEPLDCDTLDKLNPYILNLLREGQDKIVKSMYEAKNGDLSSISDEDISLSSIIQFLENENTGGRLTKEFLISWFNENVQDNISIVIAEKLGLDNPSDKDWEKINKSVNGYRDMLSSLSGGAVMYSRGQCTALLKCLEVGGVDDDVNKKLVNRLNNMMNPPAVQELLSLE